MSAVQEPPAKWKRFSLDYVKETIKVIVGDGEDKVEADVPKARLCDVSEFFAAGCSNRWASGREGVITLEEEKAQIFGLFLAWAFGGSFENSEDYITVDNDETEYTRGTTHQRHLQLIECFILGDKLLSTDFKNAVMDLLTRNVRFIQEKFNIVWGISLDVLQHFYDLTPVGSPLRRVFIHQIVASGADIQYIFSSGNPSLASLDAVWIQEFLLEVIDCTQSLVHSATKPEYPWEIDPCVYHEHPGKPDTYSCT